MLQAAAVISKHGWAYGPPTQEPDQSGSATSATEGAGPMYVVSHLQVSSEEPSRGSRIPNIHDLLGVEGVVRLVLGPTLPSSQGSFGCLQLCLCQLSGFTSVSVSSVQKPFPVSQTAPSTSSMSGNL